MYISRHVNFVERVFPLQVRNSSDMFTNRVQDALRDGSPLINSQHPIPSQTTKQYKILGVEVISTPSRLFLSQHRHIADLLSRFNMAGAKEVLTPLSSTETLLLNDGSHIVDSSSYRSIVGSLQYLAITRPDVSFAVNKLSQFMHAPTQLHLQALKRVLRYLKGTIHHGLFLNRKSAITLTAFSDSNWGGIKDNGRSTTAYILYLGSNIISWRSARQKSVSRSSTEAEYKALANASAEMMWVQNLLHELGISLHETPTLFCDNTGATYLCANPVYHSCMKHVAHFVRERVSEGSLRVLHISSKDQLVDMLTKPLGRSPSLPHSSPILPRLSSTTHSCYPLAEVVDVVQTHSWDFLVKLWCHPFQLSLFQSPRPFSHRLPQPEGNINGWLMEDEEELERNEVDSDLESTASSKLVWKKTTKADPDRASRNCVYCSK
ncbi:retrovirus-related pol polyprotein from transposon TNT 1-94 [Tanacetum coccineum]